VKLQRSMYSDMAVLLLTKPRRIIPEAACASEHPANQFGR